MVFRVARKESAFYHVPSRAVISIWVNKFVEFSNLNDISQAQVIHFLWWKSPLPRIYLTTCSQTVFF